MVYNIIRYGLLGGVLFFSTAFTALSQLSGGNGKGDATELHPPTLLSSERFNGGFGKGDATIRREGTTLASVWEPYPNNQVITPVILRDAINLGFITATNAGTLTTTLMGFSANTLSATSITLTPSDPGLHALYVFKLQNQPSQLFIKGDFRSIYINPASGQSQCDTAAGNYTQLLWLDSDQITINSTLCYTNKTLSTLYTAGNNSDWYNIKDGKAIKINNAGQITALCSN